MTYNKAKSKIYIDNYKKHFFRSGIAYPIFVCILTGNHNFYSYMPVYLQTLLFVLVILSIHNYDKWRPDKNIHRAVIANDAQGIISLVNQSKWQVNVVSLDGGFTPLHWACNSSEDEIVMLLLELGAAIDRCRHFSIELNNSKSF